MTSATTSDQGPWSTLRRFARPRPAAERCALCGAVLGPAHPHLLELARRQIQCSCDACAILFSGHEDGRFQRIVPRVKRLDDFRMTDAQWAELHLPINLAFFVPSRPSGVRACYPSPAGATESLLTLEAWETLAAENPVLHTLAPEIEALLVNRLGAARDHYRVSVDECFTLVGLIRTHWRGLSGGTAVWEEIRRFFADLDARGGPPTRGAIDARA